MVIEINEEEIKAEITQEIDKSIKAIISKEVKKTLDDLVADKVEKIINTRRLENDIRTLVSKRVDEEIKYEIESAVRNICSKNRDSFEELVSEYIFGVSKAFDDEREKYLIKCIGDHIAWFYRSSNNRTNQLAMAIKNICEKTDMGEKYDS